MGLKYSSSAPSSCTGDDGSGQQFDIPWSYSIENGLGVCNAFFPVLWGTRKYDSTFERLWSLHLGQGDFGSSSDDR